MKTRALVLLLSLFSPVAAQAVGANGLRYFFCVHAEGACKEAASPFPVRGENALAAARRALATKDDFVGFTDTQDTTLQFYVEAPDSILVDLPMPKEKGSYSTHVTRERALKLIAGLSAPLARYRTELKLKFAKWG